MVHSLTVAALFKRPGASYQSRDREGAGFSTFTEHADQTIRPSLLNERECSDTAERSCSFAEAV